MSPAVAIGSVGHGVAHDIDKHLAKSLYAGTPEGYCDSQALMLPALPLLHCTSDRHCPVHACSAPQQLAVMQG